MDRPIPARIESIERMLANLPRVTDTKFARSELPANGIYFFYEAGEGDRIVRVGTHKTDGGLYARMRTHYGSPRSLSAWRRRSVFRYHLGAALLNSLGDQRLDAWSDKRGDRMADVEELVTDRLRTTFSFRVISVDSMEERLGLERAIIATLSASPRMSDAWLGRHALRSKIRESGLWNNDHVGAMENIDLSRIEALVAAT